MTHAVLARHLMAAAISVASTPALAQKIPAGCQPVIDADRKTISTPNHAYLTQTSKGSGQTSRTLQSITVGDALYIQLSGTWRRSPLTVKHALAQLDTNITTATAYSCARVGDESAAGTSATVYSTHVENEGMKFDARIWVAKGTGLILRNEEDRDLGGGEKAHVSIRYDYANVHAPAGLK